MSGHRTERVADLVRRSLTRVMREQLRDPRVGFVTVTEVRMSPDLKQARVFVATPADDRDQALEGLDRAAPFLRRAVARDAGLRYAPRLRFCYDETLDRGQRLDELLGDRPEEPADGH